MPVLIKSSGDNMILDYGYHNISIPINSVSSKWDDSNLYIDLYSSIDTIPTQRLFIDEITGRPSDDAEEVWFWIRDNFLTNLKDVKFGRNPLINTGTTPEDVWAAGGDYTGHPLDSPDTVDLVSSSANDSSTGTGARTVIISGLMSENSTEYESEEITLNGTTPVTSVNSWWRVNRIKVLTAGSSGFNEGAITISHTSTPANIFIIMGNTLNQSTLSSFTVPDKKIMNIETYNIYMSRSAGNQGSAIVGLQIREPGSVYQTRRVHEITSSYPIQGLPVKSVIPGSDVKFRVFYVSDNSTSVTAEFKYNFAEFI